MLRALERLAERGLALFYRADRHEAHYRRVMEMRALLRSFSGHELTNTVEQGRPIFEQLREISGFDGSQRILDFGCGTAGVGFHFANALTTGTYCGVDISPSALKVARTRMPRGSSCAVHLITDETDLSVFGNFEIIVAQSVFTHCPLAVFRKFLENCSGILEDGGVILANFAISNASGRIAQTDYVFTEQEVLQVAEAMGFAGTYSELWRHPSMAKRSADQPVDRLLVMRRR